MDCQKYKRWLSTMVKLAARPHSTCLEWQIVRTGIWTSSEGWTCSHIFIGSQLLDLDQNIPEWYYTHYMALGLKLLDTQRKNILFWTHLPIWNNSAILLQYYQQHLGVARSRRRCTIKTSWSLMLGCRGTMCTSLVDAVETRQIGIGGWTTFTSWTCWQWVGRGCTTTRVIQEYHQGRSHTCSPKSRSRLHCWSNIHEWWLLLRGIGCWISTGLSSFRNRLPYGLESQIRYQEDWTVHALLSRSARDSGS